MMKGFNAKWKDFPDYIIGVTKAIWEDRGVHTLNHYYAPDIIVRSPASIVKGNEGVIAATMSTLAELPDRQLYAEDVIWTGTPDQGMLSSHRLICTATHSHYGAYGEPTGKQIKYRILADCHAINDQINDEWLVRDQAAIAMQLGKTPREYARELIELEGGIAHCVKPFLPENDIQGPYRGIGNQTEWGEKYRDILNRIMNSEFSVIPSAYDRACIGEYSGNQGALSHKEIDQFWMSLRASVPDAEFKIEHVMGNNDPMMSPRAAIRWSLNGTHSGYGMLGKPTQQRVYIMGISHVEFGPRGIRREFTLIDEVAIHKQILISQG